MFKVNMSWAPAIYEEHYNYKQKRNTRRVKDECRRYSLLKISIIGVRSHMAKDVLSYIMLRLNQQADQITRYGEFETLSSMSWGPEVIYNTSTRCYTDYICVPKNPDALEAHRRAVMASLRDIVKGAKCELTEYQTDLEMDLVD